MGEYEDVKLALRSAISDKKKADMILRRLYADTAQVGPSRIEVDQFATYADATARDLAFPDPGDTKLVIFNTELDSAQVWNGYYWRTLTRDAELDRDQVYYDDDGNVDALTAPVSNTQAGETGEIMPGWQMAESSDVIVGWATGSDKIYQYDLGTDSWSEIGTDGDAENLKRLWILEDGETLYWQVAATPDKIKRAKISGGSVVDQEVVLTMSSGDATTLADGNMTEHDGTLLLAEYAMSGSAANGVQIWRGSPWGDWEAVYTLSNGHFHAVTYHAQTAQFAASAGDNEYSTILISDDDGKTWSVVKNNGLGLKRAQPVGLLDVGHPTKLLIGSDRTSGLSYLDLVTGAIEALSHPSRSDPQSAGQLNGNGDTVQTNYWFYLRRHGDVVYAASRESSADGSPAVLWATTDLRSWVTLYNSESTSHRLGASAVDSDGRVYCFINGPTNYTQVLESPTFSRVPRTRYHNKTTNLLVSAESEFAAGTIAAGWSSGDRDGVQFGAGPDGQNSLKYSTTSDYAIATYNAVPVTVLGTVYHCRLKVRALGILHSNQQINWNIGGVVQDESFYYRPGEWNEVALPPYTAIADGDNLGIKVNILSAAGEEYSVEVTDIVITESRPGDYTPGETVIAGTDESLSRVVGAGWTHVQELQMFESRNNLQNDCTIRTYTVDGTNYAVLSYDATNDKILLTPTVAGTPQAALEVAVGFWHRVGTLWLAVRCRDDTGTEKWQLSVANGGDWSHAAEASHDVGAHDTTITIDYDGTDGLHMTYDQLISRLMPRLTNTELEACEWHY